MRTTTWMPRAAAVLCAGVLLAGCSNTTDDQPTAKSGGDAVTTAVDPAALDTGSYPTSAAPEFGRATKDDIIEVEGQRLAEFTVVPFEVDPELTMSKMPTMVMRSGKNLGAIISGAAGDIASNYKMLYGYASTAATNTPNVTDPSRSIVHAVMRFNNPEDAAAAAREIHTNLTTVDSGSGIGTPQTIGILPNTLVSTSEHSFNAGPEVSVNAFTPHGDYLIYTWASAPAAQKDWTAKAVSKALDLQGPMIDKFPAQPTKEQNGGKSADFPVIDQDKVLIYAIPEQDAQAKLGDDMAAYGPRGMSHRSTNPPLTYRVLTETGSDHNAVAKTTVYRAKDDAGAKRIVDEFVNDLTSQGFATAPSPQRLPNATCVTKDTTQGSVDYCMVANGRYVGEASGLDNKKDVDQQISAQYLILEKADQNA
ncbi:hypothetical protein ABIC28_001617 [Rhodococcus sp. PvR044]|uniref:DUF7373 family lipoprotein n=1 Tax=Rhodococcus sp. PvR044 TaxID=3156402 RepID=UPI003394BFE2